MLHSLKVHTLTFLFGGTEVLDMEVWCNLCRRRHNDCCVVRPLTSERVA